MSVEQLPPKPKELDNTDYLGINVDDINETNWGTFEADSGEYLVLTDDEANEKVYEKLKIPCGLLIYY